MFNFMKKVWNKIKEITNFVIGSCVDFYRGLRGDYDVYFSTLK